MYQRDIDPKELEKYSADQWENVMRRRNNQPEIVGDPSQAIDKSAPHNINPWLALEGYPAPKTDTQQQKDTAVLGATVPISSTSTPTMQMGTHLQATSMPTQRMYQQSWVPMAATPYNVNTPFQRMSAPEFGGDRSMQQMNPFWQSTPGRTLQMNNQMQSMGASVAQTMAPVAQTTAIPTLQNQPRGDTGMLEVDTPIRRASGSAQQTYNPWQQVTGPAQIMTREEFDQAVREPGLLNLLRAVVDYDLAGDLASAGMVKGYLYGRYDPRVIPNQMDLAKRQLQEHLKGKTQAHQPNWCLMRATGYVEQALREVESVQNNEFNVVRLKGLMELLEDAKNAPCG